MESQSVYARPHRVQDPEQLSQGLARILNLRAADVKQKLTSDKPFVWIKRQVASPEAEKIQALKPNRDRHVLRAQSLLSPESASRAIDRFVGRDSEGLEGLELKYNDYIRGEAGSSLPSGDALGRECWYKALKDCEFLPGATSISHSIPPYNISPKKTGGDGPKISRQVGGGDRDGAVHRRSPGAGEIIPHSILTIIANSRPISGATARSPTVSSPIYF